jgi:alcohol dehydrogenase class IV
MNFLGRSTVLPKTTWQGRGRVLDLAAYVKNKGPGLIVHGASFRKKTQFRDLQRRIEPKGFFYPYEGSEPTLENVRHLINYAKKKKALWLAGIGGGSILDATKAAAGLYRSEQALEVYQNGVMTERPGLPFYAIPTTAGSGSEATINAVIINEKTQTKKAIRQESFMAELVILDADLLNGATPQQISYSGLDALTQSIESYSSKGATPFTRGVAFQAFTRIMESLPKVYLDALNGTRHETEISETLLEASYLSGVAFSNSGLGIVHGIAHPLGSYYSVPHGLVCALCLPHALAMNREAMGEAYMILSQSIGGDLIERIKGLLLAMKIPSVFHSKPIFRREEILRYVLNSQSTAMNPKTIDQHDVEWMLAQLFG